MRRTTRPHLTVQGLDSALVVFEPGRGDYFFTAAIMFLWNTIPSNREYGESFYTVLLGYITFFFRVVDCGDIPVTPYDNTYAIKQMQDGHQQLLQREPATSLKEQFAALADADRLEELRIRRKTNASFVFSAEEDAAFVSSKEREYVPVSKDGKEHPRIITLGGDHTIVLPLLRSISSAYGAISVIHFDSHLDTWKPA